MKYRPQPTRLRPAASALLVSSGACLIALVVLAGCANPNFIGIQDYGTIYGNVIDTTGKPIAGAYISATGTTDAFRSSGDGSFRILHVAVGTQTVSVSAPGYGPPAAPVEILVMKDVEKSAGNITLPSTTSTPLH